MAKKKQALSPEERLAAALVPEKEWPYALPDGWKWVYLGEITTIVGGGTPSSRCPEYYDDGKIPWITPADLSDYNEVYISHGRRNITQLGLEKSSAKLMPENTVLLSSRAPIGYVAIAANDICTNQGFKSFLPSIHFIPEYLYWFLKGNQALLQQYASGTTFLELSSRRASEIKLPIPPLSEQHRLVARIESLFAKLDAAREKVQSVLDSHETRKAALLHDAFAGKLTAKWRGEHQTELREIKQFPSKLKSALNHVDALTGKWALVRLGDVITWSSGGTPSRKHPEYYSGDIPWVKTGELNNTYIYDTSEKITKEAIAQSSAKVLPVNTVLLAMYGATIGKVGILGVEAATNQACACGICSEWVDYRFLFYYLQSQKSSFICSGKGGAQPNISQTIIKQYEFPLPSLPEQQEIVRILGRLLAREQRARQAAEETLTAIDRMKQSILARAFRGEL